MMRERRLSVRRAAVDRVDAFVLWRMRTLVDRATRDSGRCRSAVIDLVTGGLVGLSERDQAGEALSAAARPGIVEEFHCLYYDSAETTWQDSTYRGVTTWKNPLDLWIYQEILQSVRPDLIVETGTAYGGSALYLADLCETLGTGHVVTIDIRDRAADVAHPRLTKIIGSSIDSDVHDRVAALVPGGGSVVVILDSDHTRDHVLAEMRLWADMVSLGSYLIVEDTNINGHSGIPRFRPRAVGSRRGLPRGIHRLRGGRIEAQTPHDVESSGLPQTCLPIPVRPVKDRSRRRHAGIGVRDPRPDAPALWVT